MNKIYSHLVIFYYVAYFMSFTKAAKYLGCSKAYISKQMSDLEREIGTALLHRNTRMVKLTLAGESVFEHAELIVREFQSVENTIASLQNKVQGLLRLTAPSAYADYILAPNLPNFLNNYPNISVDMNLTGQLLNLVDEKIDVAIRLTHEPPLDRVAKRIGDYQMMICASPSYFQKYGEPRTPGQLHEHDCLIYTSEKKSSHWPFQTENKPFFIEVKPKVSANNSTVLLKTAIEGYGIARLPSYVVQNAIQNKALKPILLNFYPSSIPIYAIYAQSRIIPPKIHAFLEFMKKVHLTL